VTPIHPKEAEIEGLASQPDVARFLDAAGTSADKIAISVVTPPKISLTVVQTGLQDQGISTFWLQVRPHHLFFSMHPTKLIKLFFVRD
jgi:hypothetical protein